MPAPTSLDIRPFRPEHAAGLVALVLPIQQQEFGLPITLDEQPDLRDTAGFYGRGGSGFWVALDGGRVVGSIGLIDLGEGLGALRKMFVAASHRGAGAGLAARLLATLLDAARTRGLPTILLGTTERFLAAHRFYEKHGFREIPAEALPARFPVMAVDRRFYRLDLPGGPA